MPAKTRLKTREHHLLEYHPPAQLRPDERNAREHPRKQIVKLRRAISEFGFLNPILADENLKVIGGHARLEAALEEKLDVVPVIRLAGLSEASKIAIAISDNQLGDLSTFDESRLSELLRNLEAVEFDVELTGFDTGEIDRLLLPVLGGGGADDAVSPDENASAVSRVGDLWLLGQHRLYCGDALETASYDALLGSERAAFIFADPPYNVPVNGHISGLGKHRHREFLNASGELSRPEFMSFLSKAMAAMASFSTDGALHAICMDWRHMSEVLEAGDKAYASLQALCVWDKQSAGMGSLWRSQHELVFVFKNGSAPHQNNVSLGIHGRYRTNIWSYPGLAGFGKGRNEALEAHPTVKPVELVADAIRDCSKRGALVLDPFAGSGTTIIAAERAHRRAAAMEIDPLYLDVAVRRWEAFSGTAATLVADGRSFAETAASRTEAQP